MIPAITQILNEIETRLNRILIINGFSLDVKSVARSRKTKFMFTELPGINYYSTGETIEKRNSSEVHLLSLSVEFINRSADVPFNDTAAILGADIVKALSEDATGKSPSLGYLVDSISLQQITPVIEQKESPYCGVAIDLIVQYKTPNLDHFTIL